MGIASSTGLASGIDTASLIEQLMQIEARPKQLAQRRIAELQREQAAFLEINSALSGLERAAGAFRLDDVFDASRASSSDTDVLSATVTGNPPNGEFDFVVDRLVSTQRRLSRGFTDRDVSGLGLTRMTFEQGGGSVRTDTALSSLNGGAGVERGIIEITDKAGNTAEIDLSRVGTVSEVLDAINSNKTVQVTASTDGDGLVIEDTSGGGGNLIIASGFGYDTAASLGIEANTSGTTVTGSNLRTISRDTALNQLNDGVGVLIKDGSTDFVIDLKNPAAGTLSIDLGEKSRQVLSEDFEFDGTTYEAGTPLSDLQALPGFSDLDDDDEPETEKEVTRARATTVGDVIDIINQQASDEGVDLVASLSAGGRGITLTDNTGGGGDLEVRNGPSGDTAEALGLLGSTGGNELTSRDLVADINSVLTSGLDGGAGLEVSDFELTDRNGLTTDLSGIDVSGSLSDLIARINADLSADGNTLRARVNDAGNGVAFDDTGSGTGAISIEGGLAEQLRVDVSDFDGATVEGRSAQLKWIGLNTELSDLNNGDGIGRGEIRITDSLGVSRLISINTSNDDSTSINTVDDLLRRINSAPDIGVTASLNANGDGIELRDTAGGTGELVIEDVEGSIASSLNLEGAFEDDGFGLVADGSYERTLEFSETDTLDTVVREINNAGVGVVASIVNDGSSNSPFRLSLTSRDTGREGRVIVDTRGADLGLDVTDEGNNARVFFGAEDPAEGLLIDSSQNSLTGVIEGVTLDLNRASEEPVTVTVSQNDTAIEDAAVAFVDAFNAVIKVFNKHDTYDEETERAGVLLGDNTVGNIRRRLYNAVQGRARNVDSSFDYLFEVGIRIGEGARLEFDAEKFRDALQRDRSGVEELIAGFRQEPNDPIEVAPGAFVTPTEDSFSTLGVGEIIAKAVEDMTDSIDGTLTNRDGAIQRQIDLQESRIENFDIQLANKRAQLEQQFLAMEKAIADLQSQQSALSQLGG